MRSLMTTGHHQQLLYRQMKRGGGTDGNGKLTFAGTWLRSTSCTFGGRAMDDDWRRWRCEVSLDSGKEEEEKGGGWRSLDASAAFCIRQSQLPHQVFLSDAWQPGMTSVRVLTANALSQIFIKAVPWLLRLQLSLRRESEQDARRNFYREYDLRVCSSHSLLRLRTDWCSGAAKT